VSGKLKVQVRVDLESSAARINVRGQVTVRNILALYALAKRANGLAQGLGIELDLSAAFVQPSALEKLQECEAAGQLPRSVDPLQAGCRLRVVTGRTAAAAGPGTLLAA
jgi:hypothetical protein